jgi:hypothetical protein
MAFFNRKKSSDSIFKLTLYIKGNPMADIAQNVLDILKAQKVTNDNIAALATAIQANTDALKALATPAAPTIDFTPVTDAINHGFTAVNDKLDTVLADLTVEDDAPTGDQTGAASSGGDAAVSSGSAASGADTPGTAAAQ